MEGRQKDLGAVPHAREYEDLRVYHARGHEGAAVGNHLPHEAGGQALDLDPAACVLWSAISSPLELFDVSAHDAILRNLRRRGNQALVEDCRLPGD